MLYLNLYVFPCRSLILLKIINKIGAVYINVAFSCLKDDQLSTFNEYVTHAKFYYDRPLDSSVYMYPKIIRGNAIVITLLNYKYQW